MNGMQCAYKDLIIANQRLSSSIFSTVHIQARCSTTRTNVNTHPGIRNTEQAVDNLWSTNSNQHTRFQRLICVRQVYMLIRMFQGKLPLSIEMFHQRHPSTAALQVKEKISEIIQNSQVLHPLERAAGKLTIDKVSGGNEVSYETRGCVPRL